MRREPSVREPTASIHTTRAMAFPVSNTALFYVIGIGLLTQYFTVLYVISPPTGLGVRTGELLEPSVSTKKATFGMA